MTHHENVIFITSCQSSMGLIWTSIRNLHMKVKNLVWWSYTVNGRVSEQTDKQTQKEQREKKKTKKSIPFGFKANNFWYYSPL